MLAGAFPRCTPIRAFRSAVPNSERPVLVRNVIERRRAPRGLGKQSHILFMLPIKDFKSTGKPVLLGRNETLGYKFFL